MAVIQALFCSCITNATLEPHGVHHNWGGTYKTYKMTAELHYGNNK